MKRAQLDRKLSKRVSIAVQARLRCRTCLDAHVEAARRVGVGHDELKAAHTADSAVNNAGARIEAFAAGAGFGRDLGVLLQLLAHGRLELPIDWRGPWDQVHDAVDALRDRTVQGRPCWRWGRDEPGR